MDKRTTEGIMAAGSGLDNLPFEITETDRQNLIQGDEKFQPLSWDELGEIIARNDLAILKRKPSDLVRYIHWTRETKATYGSMTNFLLKERLHWEPVSSSEEDGPVFATESNVPFGSPKDRLIRYNDWPYGLAPGITHLVVWLKTRIPVAGDEGYLTSESREMIDDFVTRTFKDRLHGQGNPDDSVMWFKNWVGLQSVRGVEHFHVLLRNVPRSLLDEWTAGQSPP